MLWTAAVLVAATLQQGESVVDLGLRYLVRHQAADGSWGERPAACSCRGQPGDREGGDLETTAWAILALQGAGLTELSQDEIGGKKMGERVRAALDWLVSRQDADGVFDRDYPEVNAMAALALTETYGMVCVRKDAAQKAYDGAIRAAPRSIIGRIRLGMVVESAKVGEIGSEHERRLLELAEALKREEGDLAEAGSRLLEAFAKVRREAKPGLGLDGLRPLTLSPESLNVFGAASFILDGGDQWHAWFRSLRGGLEALQRKGADCEAGSWAGESVRDRIRNAAIRLLTVQHYRCWYCRSPFRKK